MNNPIIQRELVGTLRTKKALAIQLLLVATLTGLVLLRWPSDGQVDRTGQQAQQVLQLFGYGMMVALILLAPVFPANSIVRERQQGTLALLLNSPMSPGAIFTGKIVGTLGFLALLLLLSLPAAATCYTMGGVSMPQFATVFLILAVLALQYATLGLLVSGYAATTDGALRLTYGSILGLAVVTLGPNQFLQGQLPPGLLADLIEWVRCISPVPAMMEALSHQAVGSQGLVSHSGAPMRFVILALACSVLFSVLTVRCLGQRMLDRTRDAGRITDERSTSVKVYRRVMYLWFFDPQRRSGMIGPMTNPVMVKEFRTRKFGRSHWTMRLVALCLMVSLGLMLAATRGSEDWGPDTLGGIMVLLQVALIVLLTPSLASGLISGERESGGWTLLQMTPLTPGRIVRGKLLSVMATLLLLLIATLPGYLVMILIDPERQMQKVLQVLVSLVLTALLALLLSAAVSSILQRTAQATVTAYTLLVGICAGTMLVWLGRDAPFTHRTVEAVLKLNPLAGALRLIEAPGFKQYNLIPANWWIMGGACVLCLVVLSAQTWRLTRPR